MCTVLLPPGGYPTAVNKCIISYHIISYHIVSYVCNYLYFRKLQNIGTAFRYWVRNGLQSVCYIFPQVMRCQKRGYSKFKSPLIFVKSHPSESYFPQNVSTKSLGGGCDKFEAKQWFTLKTQCVWWNMIRRLGGTSVWLTALLSVIT